MAKKKTAKKNCEERTGSLGSEDKLRNAADLLRNNMDPAKKRRVRLATLLLLALIALIVGLLEQDPPAPALDQAPLTPSLGDELPAQRRAPSEPPTQTIGPKAPPATKRSSGGDPVASTRPAEPNAPRRPLEGRVIDERTKSPISGAKVQLDRPPLPGVFSLESAGNRPPAVWSDSTGRFRLPLPPGWDDTYVEVGAPGYRRLFVELETPDREQTVALERAVTMRGRVRNNHGSPVLGAEVTLLEDSEFNTRRHRTNTDAEGRFRFEGRGTTPRPSWLVLTATGYGPQEVEASGPGPFEIVLRPAATLRGRVLGPKGPVAGASVGFLADPGAARFSLDGLSLFMFMSDAWESNVELGRISWATSSNEDGTFELEGLSEGKVSVRVIQEGFVPRALALRLPAPAQDIRLEPSTTLQGLVQGASGQPLPGVALWARSAGDASGPALAATLSDGEGKFSLEGVAAGTWVDLNGYGSFGARPVARLEVLTVSSKPLLLKTNLVVLRLKIVDREGKPLDLDPSFRFTQTSGKELLPRLGGGGRQAVTVRAPSSGNAAVFTDDLWLLIPASEGKLDVRVPGHSPMVKLVDAHDGKDQDLGKIRVVPN